MKHVVRELVRQKNDVHLVEMFLVKTKHYLFPCEYFHTEIRGKGTDKYGCPGCGAPYKENLDLKVAEEEENLKRMHYEEYMYLRDLHY